MIKHRPVVDVDKVIDHYSKKDGVQVEYVCTSELKNVANRPVDIFYREMPHPEFGNRYFGLYTNDDGTLMITNADSIENESFPMIKDSNGDLHYSRYRHDFYGVGNGNAIDGGRAYCRVIGTAMVYNFVVLNGQFKEEKNNEATP